jgi:hypothetical protein
MDVFVDRSAARSVGRVFGADNRTGPQDGFGGRGVTEERLKQQRVEREQSYGRAAPNSLVQAPAHGPI